MLTAKVFLRTVLYVVGFLAYIPISLCSFSQSDSSLAKAEQLIKSIKQDETNHSFTLMLNDKVMKEHTLNSHKEGQPYFYTDKRHNVSEIVGMVLERPSGVIDETATTGFLKIYRTFNFQKDARVLFVKEKRSFNNDQKAYLGMSPEGPTNQVMVIIKTDTSKKSSGAFEPVAFSTSTAQFVDAYPVKLK